ncbi:MAG: hypothetical protein BA863_05850 [Desulfovibrio sp. S3730MH75]|nr:MAG: hypothetical protein BA863_05850 [Desulfovibrio sp. S3730MH75]
MENDLLTQVQALKLCRSGKTLAIEFVQIEEGRRKQPLFSAFLTLDDGSKKQIALARGGPRKLYGQGALTLAEDLEFDRAVFRFKNGL